LAAGDTNGGIDERPYESTFFAYKHGIPHSLAFSIIARYGPSRVQCDLVAAAVKRAFQTGEQDATKVIWDDDPPMLHANDQDVIEEEAYHARYFARKHHIPLPVAIDIIRKHGPSRQKCNEVAAKLRNR
jgi:hypothetical protein